MSGVDGAGWRDRGAGFVLWRDRGAGFVLWRDRGAGSVLMVALIAVVAIAGLTMLGGAHALVRAQQLSAAADAAALGAGDVLLGWTAGDPCTVAERVAAAHSVRLTGCASEGLTVLVRVEASILSITVARSARAGAPDAEW